MCPKTNGCPQKGRHWCRLQAPEIAENDADWRGLVQCGKNGWTEYIINWSSVNKMIIKCLQDNHAHSLSSLVIFRIVHKCQFSPQLQMFQKTTLVSAKCQMCRSCQLSSIWRRRMGWDWLKQVCNRTSCRSERNADCPAPPAPAPPASPQAALRSNQPPVAYPRSQRPQHIAPSLTTRINRSFWQVTHLILSQCSEDSFWGCGGWPSDSSDFSDFSDNRSC